MNPYATNDPVNLTEQIKKFVSRARPANTYRANGCPPHSHQRLKRGDRPIEVRYEPYSPKGKYTPSRLRIIRAERGVGRPPQGNLFGRKPVIWRNDDGN